MSGGPLRGDIARETADRREDRADLFLRSLRLDPVLLAYRHPQFEAVDRVEAESTHEELLVAVYLVGGDIFAAQRTDDQFLQFMLEISHGSAFYSNPPRYTKPIFWRPARASRRPRAHNAPRRSPRLPRSGSAAAKPGSCSKAGP